jgi:hypothetical protein
MAFTRIVQRLKDDAAVNLTEARLKEPPEEQSTAQFEDHQRD